MRKNLWLSLLLSASIPFTLAQGNPNQGQIKPELQYASYLGGSGTEIITATTADSQGNLYVAGFTRSNDYLTTPGAYRERWSSLGCAWNGCHFGTFLTKFSPDGKAILYSTYLGDGFTADVHVSGAGRGVFQITAIKTTEAGEIFLAGEVADGNSSLRPTPGAYQTECPRGRFVYVGYYPSYLPNSCGFVAKMNAAGSALLYVTYLGGVGPTQISELAIDEAGNAYVTGNTADWRFPTTFGAYQERSVGRYFRTTEQKAFVTKINPWGTGLVFSTYLDGLSNDRGQGLALNEAGEVWVLGGTSSIDFPVAGATQPGIGGGTDAFISRLSADGRHLLFSTFLGGTANELATALLVHGGDVYVGGYTGSVDFPVTSHAFQKENELTVRRLGGFITKISGETGQTIYATYYGGVLDLSMGNDGTLHVMGKTADPNLPTKHAFQENKAGEYWDDIFLSGLSKDGKLEYATYLGGQERELFANASRWANGYFWVTGSKVADDADFPVTDDALQVEPAGGGDSFIAKIFAGAPRSRRGRRLRVESDTPKCVAEKCGMPAGRLRPR